MALLQTFSWCAAQLSFSLSMTPSSFALGLGLIQCVSMVGPVGWISTSGFAFLAFSCEWVKSTRVSLFISSGELYVHDQSKTLFLHSIMFLRMAWVLSRSLPLASKVVSSTKPIILSLWLLLSTDHMSGALYMAYSSMDSRQPWQQPLVGEKGSEV